MTQDTKEPSKALTDAELGKAVRAVAHELNGKKRAVEAEMAAKVKQGVLWTNALCADFDAYQRAVAELHRLVDDL